THCAARRRELQSRSDARGSHSPGRKRRGCALGRCRRRARRQDGAGNIFGGVRVNLVLQTLVSTVVQGSMLALITIGMSLVYGTLRVLNMAQGVMVMVGGMAAYLAVDGLGVSPWVSIIFAMLATFVLGMATYGIGVSKLIGRAGVDFEMTAFISTF